LDAAPALKDVKECCKSRNQTEAANYANYANGPHVINAVGNDRNSVWPIRVIRAIRDSDFGCGYAAL